MSEWKTPHVIAMDAIMNDWTESHCQSQDDAVEMLTWLIYSVSLTLGADEDGELFTVDEALDLIRQWIADWPKGPTVEPRFAHGMWSVWK